LARKIVIRAISNCTPENEKEFRLNDEWICLANEGTTTEYMEGWILINWKPDNRHYYHFYFPHEVDYFKMNFKPGQLIFVMTGSGKDVYIPAAEGSPGQFHFYQNLDHFIWNIPKEKAYLYSYKKEREKEIYELVAQKEVTG
jgi:hypothetical protein